MEENIAFDILREKFVTIEQKGKAAIISFKTICIQCYSFPISAIGELNSLSLSLSLSGFLSLSSFSYSFFSFPQFIQQMSKTSKKVSAPSVIVWFYTHNFQLIVTELFLSNMDISPFET